LKSKNIQVVCVVVSNAGEDLERWAATPNKPKMKLLYLIDLLFTYYEIDGRSTATDDSVRFIVVRIDLKWFRKGSVRFVVRFGSIRAGDFNLRKVSRHVERAIST
jgi:hypothetical protein